MGDAAAEFDLVQGLLDERRWQEALRIVGPLRRTHSTEPRVWQCQAEALRGAGHLTEAVVAAEKWLELSTDSVEARRFRDELGVEVASRNDRSADARRAWTTSPVAGSARFGSAGSVGRPTPRASLGGPGGCGGGRPESRRPVGSGGSGNSKRENRLRFSRSMITVVVVVVLLGVVAYPRWRSIPSSDGSNVFGGFGVLQSQQLPSPDLMARDLRVPYEPPTQGRWTFLYEHRGNPVRHDPCHTIHYRVRIGSGPTGGVAMVQEALRIVGEATGLQFSYDGLTDDVPTSSRRVHDVNDPVVIAWATNDETDLFDAAHNEAVGDALGVGGPSLLKTPDGKERLVGGEVVLRSMPKLPQGFSRGASQGNVLLHELGHLVGLGHVDDRNELMNPSASDNTLNGYGPGDLRGLWLLGASQGCL